MGYRSQILYFQPLAGCYLPGIGFIAQLGAHPGANIPDAKALQKPFNSLLLEPVLDQCLNQAKHPRRPIGQALALQDDGQHCQRGGQMMVASAAGLLEGVLQAAAGGGEIAGTHIERHAAEGNAINRRSSPSSHARRSASSKREAARGSSPSIIARFPWWISANASPAGLFSARWMRSLSAT